ncbi:MULTISPECIES: ABC transporter permease [unclassified Cytobacillus]|jgi:putative aldouronate transport system permease protein|uniref:ABC transporter permease n=1 Tax=unclassified Cytobacillus TaxID=2675268 RepID=UPI00135C83B2|nr:ABC transporter permease subunit [Cytobacillus sp. AMY 15.2]KAF0819628.1 ABC transporter, permease protein 1 (cluster 1, maltose/g3p/polyamine/iron) [Bacillus sp. ZZV12-4809]MCM3090689.1 ABC transporter permease subunit [Cytobacillus sp. AMY 15.2]
MKKGILKQIKSSWVLYLMLFPALLYFSIFHVVPLIGMKLAFQDYRIIGDNVWVGMKHFKILFSSPAFLDVLQNTIIISVMKIVFFFPIPIILSLLINEVRVGKFRKYVQSIVYLPHFLSWVVIAGIWIAFLNPEVGGVNVIRSFFNMPSLDFMTSKDHIRWVLVFQEIWRSAGWDSIIYLAAILKISPSLYEAAKIDGASKIQQMRYITLPSLTSTIMTVFILNLGFFMNAGFDQVFNMMNSSVISVIDILDTYVYRIGLLNGQYAYATAASLFKGVIGVILILSTHFISKRISGKGVW